MATNKIVTPLEKAAITPNPSTAPFRTGIVPTITQPIVTIKNNEVPALRNIYGDTATGDTYKWQGKDRTVFSDGKTYYILRDDNTRMPVTLSNKSAPTKETTKKETTTTKTSGGGGGGGGGSDPALLARLNDLYRQLEELKKPNVMSADELAEIYGWDYNLDNIRANFDEKTRQYYDDLIAKQEQYRTDYVADNARYDRNIYNNYVDSYRNAAQTRSGKAIRSANLLSSMINADQLNSENDYGMLQSVNNLREAQKAEYENNPYLAEQAYNTLGTYASQLSANLNASQVQQYADKLTALANMYSAERLYQGYLAQGAASKYSGLANAAITNAQTATNGTYDNYFNYYYNLARQTGSVDPYKQASKNVANLIDNSYKVTR